MDENHSIGRPSRLRRRFTKVPTGVLIAAGLGSVLIAGSSVAVISGFTASITNSVNTVGSGALIMTESSGANTCVSSGSVVTSNTATCSTINKYGASTSAVPGTPISTTVTITDSGTVAANTFTLTAGSCTQSNNGAFNGTDASFCGKVDVTIQESGKTACVFPASASVACPATPTSAGTLASLSGASPTLTPGTVAAGASRTFVITVMLDSTTATNADQGLLASQTLTWSFSS
jgi:hypothetical protein